MKSDWDGASWPSDAKMKPLSSRDDEKGDFSLSDFFISDFSIFVSYFLGEVRFINNITTLERFHIKSRVVELLEFVDANQFFSQIRVNGHSISCHDLELVEHASSFMLHDVPTK